MHLDIKFYDSCDYFDHKSWFFTSNKSIEDWVQSYVTKTYSFSFMIFIAFSPQNWVLFPYRVLASKNTLKIKLQEEKKFCDSCINFGHAICFLLLTKRWKTGCNDIWHKYTPLHISFCCIFAEKLPICDSNGFYQ